MHSLKLISLILLFGVMFSSSCVSNTSDSQKRNKNIIKAIASDIKLDTATFAGGCFWCIEASFEQIEGVIEAVSGYAGGTKHNARYDLVSSGKTAHAEAVQIYYDPNKISFETLLDILFTAHDPTQLNRQGPDVGKQYRSVVFYHNGAQKEIVSQKIKDLSPVFVTVLSSRSLNLWSLFIPLRTIIRIMNKRIRISLMS